MYEPDLEHIKRRLGRAATTPRALVLPAKLPTAMIERGYRLEAGVLYWESLPLSEMSARGTLKLFKEYLQ